MCLLRFKGTPNCALNPCKWALNWAWSILNKSDVYLVQTRVQYFNRNNESVFPKKCALNHSDQRGLYEVWAMNERCVNVLCIVQKSADYSRI